MGGMKKRMCKYAETGLIWCDFRNAGGWKQRPGKCSSECVFLGVRLPSLASPHQRDGQKKNFLNDYTSSFPLT